MPAPEAPGARRARRGPGGVWRSLVAEGASPSSILGRDAIHRRSLVLADLLAAAVALGLCVGVLGDGRLEPAALIAFPVVALVSKVIGLYDRDELVLRKSTLDEAPQLFQLASLYALLVWLGQDLLVAGELGRSQVLALWIVGFLGVMVARAAARAAAMRLTEPERILLVGDHPTRRWLEDKLAGSVHVKAELVGFVGLDERPDGPTRPSAGGGGADSVDRTRLGALVARHDVHRVMIAPSLGGEGDATLDIISWAKGFGVKVSIVPRMFEVVGSSVEFDDLDGVTVLGVRRFGLSRSSRVVKRTLDLVGSVAGLVALAPLMALIAVLIRLDSPGPVLFRQTRIGRDGKPFRLLKFRSMVEGADEQKAALEHLNEADGLFKIAEDPRITRVGRVLRRSSLDELPQLVNVVRGEMSLVGPRPLVREDDQRVEGWHRRRLHLTPGMTGEWQVLGSSRIPLQEMVTIDCLYVANWSLWTDMKILLRTVAYVLRRRGL